MRVLTNIKGNQSDFLQEAGQNLVSSFSIVFGRTYNIKDKIVEENTSIIKKVITVFIAVILLPLTLLSAAIGAIMVSCSSSHKKAYKQILEEQNHTKKKPHTAVPKIINLSLVKEKTSQIELFIKEKCLQEKIALNARYHLHSHRICEYPRRRLFCDCVADKDDELYAKSRAVLLGELSIDLLSSLNALDTSEKKMFLNQIIETQITEYYGIVRQMEKDLFSFFNQPDVLDALKFDAQELKYDTLNENIKANFRQRLTAPLSERLNQFPPEIQDDLLVSAYCQLNKRKTGTHVEIGL